MQPISSRRKGAKWALPSIRYTRPSKISPMPFLSYAASYSAASSCGSKLSWRPSRSAPRLCTCKRGGSMGPPRYGASAFRCSGGCSASCLGRYSVSLSVVDSRRGSFGSPIAAWEVHGLRVFGSFSGSVAVSLKRLPHLSSVPASFVSRKV